MLCNGNLIETSFYKNTCAFDATIQCIVNIKLTHNDLFQEAECPITKVVTALYEGNANLAENLRYDALFSIKKNLNYDFGLESNCECNVTQITDFFFKKNPSCIAEFFCDICRKPTVENRPYISIDIVKLEKIGIQNLEKSFSAIPQKRCCGLNLLSPNTQLSQYAIINTEYLNSQTQKPIALQHIPQTIKIENKVLKINSIISYQPNHYTAYCKKNDYWEEFDDLKENVVKIRNSSKCVTPHFLCYTMCN